MWIEIDDLGLPYRDETDDEVTIQSAEAILKYNVGVKWPLLHQMKKGLKVY